MRAAGGGDTVGARSWCGSRDRVSRGVSSGTVAPHVGAVKNRRGRGSRVKLHPAGRPGHLSCFSGRDRCCNNGSGMQGRCSQPVQSY